MPWYRMRQDLGGPNTDVFHIKVERRYRTPACGVCGYIAERQCDRIVNPHVLKHGKPLRCDRWLCIYCTAEPAPGKDLCPPCALEYRAWLAARSNSTDGEGF